MLKHCALYHERRTTSGSSPCTMPIIIIPLLYVYMRFLGTKPRQLQQKLSVLTRLTQFPGRVLQRVHVFLHPCLIILFLFLSENQREKSDSFKSDFSIHVLNSFYFLHAHLSFSYNFPC